MDNDKLDKLKIKYKDPYSMKYDYSNDDVYELISDISACFSLVEAAQAELAENHTTIETLSKKIASLAKQRECADDAARLWKKFARKNYTENIDLRAQLEAAQDELVDVRNWTIKYREAIIEDKAMAASLAEAQEDAEAYRKAGQDDLLEVHKVTKQLVTSQAECERLRGKLKNIQDNSDRWAAIIAEPYG